MMEVNFNGIENGPDSLANRNSLCGHTNRQSKCECAQEQMGGESLNQKARKKKKKQKGSLQSPKQIMAFDTCKLLNLNEQKANSKSLSKCSTFPASRTRKAVLESSGISKDSNETTIPGSPDKNITMCSQIASLPLKSALRVSIEELGVRPRPQLQVHWDPNVWEPQCSSISHTVIKKKGLKQVSNGGHPCMKHKCQKSQNIKSHRALISPKIVLGSRLEQSDQDVHKHAKVLEDNNRLLQTSSCTVSRNLKSESVDGSLVSRKRAGQGTSEAKADNLINCLDSNDCARAIALLV